MREPAGPAALLAALLCLASCAAGAGTAAQPPREVHGGAEAFAARGVALAWGVLRGTDEASTVVVLRIAAERASYPWLAVAGSDPFTQNRKRMIAATPSGDVVEVRAPRSHFADFPRTEVRFYDSAAAAQGDKPALVVFFLGVPDTTPEFTNEDRLQSYLTGRVARPLSPAE